MLEEKQISLNTILDFVKEDLEVFDDRLLNEISPASRSLSSILQNVFQNGGKRIRPTLSFLFTKLIANQEIDKEKVFLVAEISELIHTASLVHDDIIDNSFVRRGQPTTNSKWNNAITVISGDFMFARAAVNLGKVGINQITSIYAKVLEDLCDGEIWQAEKKFTAEVDYEFYLSKTFKKTASLFEAACKASAIISKASEEQVIAAADYGRNLGMAFQIVDDILDYTEEAETLGKPALADLKEGHVTLPLLICLEDYKINSEDKYTELVNLINLIKENPDESSDYLEKVKSFVMELDGVNKSFDYAKKFTENAANALKAFDDNETKKVMEDLLIFVTQRKS
jgi:all-trans-nonaprenyl-diphosphate synthase